MKTTDTVLKEAAPVAERRLDLQLGRRKFLHLGLVGMVALTWTRFFPLFKTSRSEPWPEALPALPATEHFESLESTEPMDDVFSQDVSGMTPEEHQAYFKKLAQVIQRDMDEWAKEYDSLNWFQKQVRNFKYEMSCRFRPRGRFGSFRIS